MTSKAFGLAQLGNAYADGALSNRNLIINGAMQVAQRGTSSTSTGFQTVDRWRIETTGTDELAFTQAQVSDAPDGFAYSYKFTVTTPETSITDSEWLRARYTIEGQDAQSLAFGTSSAKQATLSFWVKSSVTGSYAVLFYLGDAARSQTLTYTVNSSNTWEYKTITFDGDTVATINNNNTAGPDFYFSLSAGPDRKTSDGTSWGTFAQGKSAYGQTANVAATSAATWQITGVQLEAGDTATPFEHRSYGAELALCQRYYQTYSYVGVDTYVGADKDASSSMWLTVQMRAGPTVTYGAHGFRSNTTATTPFTTTISPTNNYILFQVTGTSANTRTFLYNPVYLSAEL